MMNDQERKVIAKTIVYMGLYYNRPLEKPVVEMMVDDLADLDFQLVSKAFEHYRKNPMNKFFPLPAVIRDIVSPSENPDDLARETAAKIEGAIVKFGHPNGSEARAYLGEDAWDIVDRYGGWAHLCENHGLSISPQSFQAQVREQLKTKFTMRRSQDLVKSITHGAGFKLRALPWEKN